MRKNRTTRGYHKACHDVVLAAQEFLAVWDACEETGNITDTDVDSIRAKVDALRADVRLAEEA